MNKTAIKNFAVWARRKLISEITYKAEMIGVSANGILESLPNSTKDLQLFDVGTNQYAEVSGEAVKQRNELVAAIRAAEKSLKYAEAFENVVEEVAYTWFNRLIAIRFMEVNDYLPSGVRVLSSENSAKNEPDFVTTPFDTDLEFTPFEQDKVIQLKDENKLDELFRMLFIKECNKLHEILPELFEKTDDYTELLLTISFTDKDGVVYHLVHDIEEKDFNVAEEGQVEIIGWMYQYYISEPKDVLINARKKYKTSNIPPVTQLFTSDWIVRYMVDNSLGKYWTERNPNTTLHSKLSFYAVPNNESIVNTNEKVLPTEITFLDPCMGSGHILIYAFEVFMNIYREYGYSDRDAVKEIIEKNLFGIDISKRAYQLAYFSLMMIGRAYDRRLFSRNIKPNLYYPKDYKEGETIGSLLLVENLGEMPTEPTELTIFNMDWESELNNWKFRKVLTDKYSVVCTNPPYMNSSYMPAELSDYLQHYYTDYKTDLFAAFIIRAINMAKDSGYVGMLTPYVWMFLSSYENLREAVLKSTNIMNLVQLEYNAFEGACVPVGAFVLKKTLSDEVGDYIRLSEFKGISVQAPKTLEAIQNPKCGYRYAVQQKVFFDVPGKSITYWLSNRSLELFKEKKVSDYGEAKKGLSTGDNNKFLRFWYEVSNKKTAYNLSEYKLPFKWIPLNKGGSYRKWYGNNDYVINWYDDGAEIKDFDGSVIRNPHYYFSQSITWTMLSNSCFGVRFSPIGKIFEGAGPSLFVKENIYYMLAFLCSKIADRTIRMLNPTMNINIGDICNLPFIISEEKKEIIKNISKNCVSKSREEWDSFETSWDFKKHPLVSGQWAVDSVQNTDHSSLITDHYTRMKKECNDRFNKLKSNEEELNRVFIDIYGLQDELTPEVEDKDVTVHYIADTKEDAPESLRNSNYLLAKQDVIKSFISYAVGCMFGRYSIYKEGLIYAGGDLKDVYEKYEANMEFSQVDEDTIKYKGNKEFYYLKGQDIEPMKGFKVDADNIIPITDEPYFKDDIVGLFQDFVAKVYGKETLEENLDFIASALGNKGNTSREVIRNYFLNDFIKDHIKTYQKRPIYWLFDSGKQNGFKALCYMHRYNADTIGNMRIEYLHRVQRVYEKEIERMQEIIDNSTNAREVSTAEKRKDKLTKQLKETKDYDEKVAHLALSRIDIDLDDGVKVNYEKVQTAQDGRKLEMLAKI